MNISTAMNLTQQYAECPECGNSSIGNGEGTLEIGDTTFVRECKCGWKFEIDTSKGAVPDVDDGV